MVKKNYNEENSFEDMLVMLRKKVQEKDDEIIKLQEENAKLREALPEGVVLDCKFRKKGMTVPEERHASPLQTA